MKSFLRTKSVIVGLLIVSLLFLGIVLSTQAANAGRSKFLGSELLGSIGSAITNFLKSAVAPFSSQQNSSSMSLTNNLLVNNKDLSKYYDSEVFLISDKNWRDILGLVPAITPVVSEKSFLITKDDLTKEKYNGFIVSFSEEPVLLYKKDLENQKKTKSQISFLIETYKNSLVSKHSLVKQKLGKEKIGRDFYDVYNGLILNITEQECQGLVKQKLVESCFKNSEVKAFLNESVPLIKADQVWRLRDSLGRNITGQNVTISIIDTGVDYAHHDLDQGKVVREHCYCSYGGACCPNGQVEQHGVGSAMDDMGHGTHCASIAAGTGEASNGLMKGVAPDAKIEAIKALDNSGSGYESDIIFGIEKAIEDDTSIISMSLGVSSYSLNDCYEDVLSQVVDNAVFIGIPVVVAAGNNGDYSTVNAPGCAKKVITVGASDKHDQMANFSSRGPIQDLSIKPDIIAPGVNICAAKASKGQIGSDCYQNQGTYVSLSGTSMATPHVAGLVALIKQKHPDWAPQEIKQSLRDKAVSINEDFLTQGYGRVDALASVLSIKPPIAKLNTSGILNGTSYVMGDVNSDDFASYKLEYGQGIQPTSWRLLIESQTIPASGVLYRWNTNLLEDGIYLLKLTAINKHFQASQDKTLVIIANNRKFDCSNSLECNIFGTVSDSRINLINNLGENEGCNFLSRALIKGENISFDCKNYKIISGEQCNTSTYGPYFGILIYNAKNSEISNCETSGFIPSGIFSQNSYEVNLKNNYSLNNTYGIDLINSHNFELFGNRMTNNIINFDIYGTLSNHSIDNSNKINGRSFLYLYNRSNEIIQNFDGAAIYVFDSNSLTIKNNKINSEGIFAKYSSNLSISNNSVTNAPRFGIWLYNTNGSTITNNIITDAEQIGIEMDWSRNNLAKWNVIQSNLGGMLIAPYTDNAIFENTINVGPGWYKAFSDQPIELSYNRRGNYWGRSEAPYFCEFGNQHSNCIDNWDSNREDIIDSCPYNQSYLPGQWPASPVCNDSPLINSGSSTSDQVDNTKAPASSSANIPSAPAPVSVPMPISTTKPSIK